MFCLSMFPFFNRIFNVNGLLMLFFLELIHPFEKIPEDDDNQDGRKQYNKELDDQIEDEEQEQQPDEEIKPKLKHAFWYPHKIRKVPEV